MSSPCSTSSKYTHASALRVGKTRTVKNATFLGFRGTAKDVSTSHRVHSSLRCLIPRSDVENERRCSFASSSSSSSSSSSFIIHTRASLSSFRAKSMRTAATAEKTGTKRIATTVEDCSPPRPPPPPPSLQEEERGTEKQQKAFVYTRSGKNNKEALATKNKTKRPSNSSNRSFLVPITRKTKRLVRMDSLPQEGTRRKG